MDRRTFIQTSTAIAAGSTLLPAAALAAGEHAHDSPMPLSRPKPLSSHDGRVRRLLSRMTLEEKVGQMVQAESGGLQSPDDVGRYFLGSLFSGGNDDPKAGNSLESWTDWYDAHQSLALGTRLGIPLLYGIDAVHGHNNVLGAVIFPHNIGMGCTRNASLVERAARVTADEVRATGIQWAFAPCVAVPRDIRWGRTYEGYGESPALARTLGGAAVRGFQQNDLGHHLSVLACAKHFAGDGGTVYGTGTAKSGSPTEHWPLDRGDTRLTERELEHLHMQGYVAALEHGVGTIMPSYSSWNGVKCSASRRLLIEILKQQMGFEGFLISDYNAIEELPGDYKSQIEQSVIAGMDMFMVPNRYQEFYKLLMELVSEQRVPERRINGAVTRILRVKFATGLMDKRRSPLANRRLQRTFGSASHRLVARECVRQSLVLLKNESRTLPLSKHLARIHVGGKSADDIGNQCGGWTISWQGKSGGDVITGGTTILAAIRNAVSSDTSITFSKDGSGAEGASVGIAVIGEAPYAEMFGDREELQLDAEDVAAVENMARAGIPVVVVLISGRPMILGEMLDRCKAFVAAWLPGTEGDGVADVLFGGHRPTGKLSHSWPRTMAQIPINLGDAGYDPLFKYGYGLTY